MPYERGFKIGKGKKEEQNAAIVLRYHLQRRFSTRCLRLNNWKKDWMISYRFFFSFRNTFVTCGRHWDGNAFLSPKSSETKFMFIDPLKTKGLTLSHSHWWGKWGLKVVRVGEICLVHWLSAARVHNWQMRFWKWTGKHRMQRICQSAARKWHSSLSSKRCWNTKLLFLNTAPCAEVLNWFIYPTQTWLESVSRKVPASCSIPAEETGSRTCRQCWFKEGWKQWLDSARSFGGNKLIRDVAFLVGLNISNYREDTNVIKIVLSSE